MTKTKQNFNAYQGEDKTLEATIYDESDAVLNITGASFLWVLYNAGASVLSRTSVLGITTTVASAGVIQVTVPASATVSLDPGNYYHECKMEDSASKYSVVFTGTMALSQSYTAACAV